MNKVKEVLEEKETKQTLFVKRSAKISGKPTPRNSQKCLLNLKKIAVEIVIEQEEQKVTELLIQN